MKKTKAFTLIELLVVISIIALLIGILLPALGAARNSARDVICMTHARTHGLAFLLYAADYDDQLPPFSEGVPGDGTSPNYTTLQDPREAGGKVWYEFLVEHGIGYEGFDAAIGHHNDPREGVWRCPRVDETEMEDVHGNTPTWGGGYGVALNIIGYGTGRNSYADGSPRTADPRSASNLMLVGDTGRPDFYRTRATPFRYVTWMRASNPPYTWFNPKGDQVAARHSQNTANITFFDGHAASVSYDDIQNNTDDLFGLDDPKVTNRLSN